MVGVLSDKKKKIKCAEVLTVILHPIAIVGVLAAIVFAVAAEVYGITLFRQL